MRVWFPQARLAACLEPALRLASLISFRSFSFPPARVSSAFFRGGEAGGGNGNGNGNGKEMGNGNKRDGEKRRKRRRRLGPDARAARSSLACRKPRSGLRGRGMSPMALILLNIAGKIGGCLFFATLSGQPRPAAPGDRAECLGEGPSFSFQVPALPSASARNPPPRKKKRRAEVPLGAPPATGRRGEMGCGFVGAIRFSDSVCRFLA